MREAVWKAVHRDFQYPTTIQDRNVLHLNTFFGDECEGKQSSFNSFRRESAKE